MNSDQQQVQRALDTAHALHSDQFRRRSSMPYVVHPIAVAKRLWGWGVRGTDIIVTALLHDVLEDTAVTLEELEEAFGPDIARHVSDLTFVLDAEAPTTADVQKAEYIKSFDDKDGVALLVKLADRIENLLDFLDEGNTNFNGYYNNSLPLFVTYTRRRDPIREAFGDRVAVRIDSDLQRLLGDLL